MKKILTILTVMIALAAAAVPGTVHLIYSNGEVTTSGDDTFFEFDVQAYVSGTENENDLYLADGMVYVQYNTELFGSEIAGTENLVVTRKGILDNSMLYQITNSNNTAPNLFAFSFISPYSINEKQYYTKVSNDALNPSDLFHIKMKVKASGSGILQFPDNIPMEELYWTLSDQTYTGGLDITDANEDVYIEGPIAGEPYTSIELKSLDAVYKGGMVRLKWKTASETENMGFIIKRALCSDDMIGIYEEVDSYRENDALLGAGTTSNNTTYLWFDKSVRPGLKYAYVLQDVDYEGHIRESDPVIVTIPENKILTTDKFEFAAGYPNPFNPYFVVPFEIFEATAVDIRVYDMQGRLVKVLADREFAPGTYNLLMDGSGLSSGMYLLRTRVENFTETQKMMLVK
ncbi:MAG: T9SS type A sorting domain-containing protein [Candidatus Neomarinimicrobiota bacterium]